MKARRRKAAADSRVVPDQKFESIGVRDLKAGLSGYLRRVRAGQSLVVTDHGEPVAHIIPIGMPTGLERLLSEGRASWAGAGTGPGMPSARLQGPKTAAEHIIEDRNARESELDAVFRRKSLVAGKS